MEETEKTILDLKLNAEGSAWLLRFCKVASWVILLAILSAIPSFIHNTARIMNGNSYRYIHQPLIRIEFLVHPYFWLFNDLLWMLQLFYYWRFRREIKRSIATINDGQFSRSFSNLYNSARVSVILLVLGLIANAYTLFLDIKYEW